MHSFLALPVNFGTSQPNSNRDKAASQLSRLPQWLILYVRTPGVQGRDAEVRLACRATQVLQHKRELTNAEAHECQLWSSQGLKQRKRDSQGSASSANSFCFWSLDQCFKFLRPVPLERSQFSGGQLQRASRPTTGVWDLCKAAVGNRLLPAKSEEKPFAELRPTAAWLLQVPFNLALLRLDPENMPSQLVLCTPLAVAASLRVTVCDVPDAGREARAGAGDHQHGVAAGAAGAHEQELEANNVEEHVGGLHLAPMQEIHVLRLNFALQNARDLPVVVNSVARFLAPITGDLDPTKLEQALCSVPSKDRIRRNMLKLDMLHMFWRRTCMEDLLRRNVRVARFLSMDASPQGGYEYLAMTEEIMQREQPFQVPDSPWAGFEHEVRTLPIMTLARGETRTFVKAQRLKHAICLENSVSNLEAYRSQVKGWVSDQGTEKGIPNHPLGGSARMQGLTSSLQEEATLEGLVASTRETFLWNSFSHPGMLHIMFNALEESCKGCPRWEHFEKQLSAVSKLLTNRSFREVVLHRMMSEATRAEKKTVQGYHGELLSWRWESLHLTLRHYAHVRPILAKYWDRELLASEASLCDAVSSALSDPFHQAYVEWALMFSGFVQKWAHWLEGCFCHEEELKCAKSRKEREAIRCCWKGRRTPVLIAGAKEQMVEAMQRHGTFSYTQAMLELPREVAAGMALMDKQARDKWCAVLRQKMSYLDHVPHKLAGAFAHLAQPDRYSLLGSKRMVRECFTEYEALKSKGRTNALLTELFEHAATGGTAEQLWAYANSDETKQLRDFPLAWAEIQERAFCTNVERMTERQHVLVKMGAQRALRYAGPAMTCVRARRSQLQAMIDNPIQCAFLIQQWPRRTIYSDLLSHVMTPAECRRATTAYRVSRVYGYSEADHFLDEMQEEEQSALALANATAAALRDAEPAPGVSLQRREWMIVDFLKSQLQTGTIFSVPGFLFGRMVCEAVPDPRDEDRQLELEGFVASLMPENLPELVPAEHVYCYVLDAWPERRTQVQSLAHAGTDRRGHVHVIQFLNVDLSREMQPMVSHKHVKQRTLNFCHVATLPDLELFSSSLHLWRAECKGLDVEVRPLPDVEASAQLPHAIALPHFVTDDDMLMDAARSHAREEQLVVRDDDPGVRVRAGLLSNQEQRMLNELFKCKAVGGNFVEALRLQDYNAPAIQGLLDKRLALSAMDDFGELTLSLSADIGLSTCMLLKEPVVLSAHEGELRNPAGRNKLGWLKLLLQKAWKPTRNKPEWRLKGTRKLLPSHLLDAPEAHLNALAMDDSIWQKPGDLQRISHSGSAAYYRMLLQEPDLTGVQDWTLEQCREYTLPKKRKAARSRAGQPGGVSKRAEPLRLALELPTAPPVQARVPGLLDLAVHFDNFTHQSGNRRAFVKCLHAAHGNSCRRYTFVNQHDDETTAVAWLFAWAQDAARHATSEAHVAYNPSHAAVRRMKERQALGA